MMRNIWRAVYPLIIMMLLNFLALPIAQVMFVIVGGDIHEFDDMNLYYIVSVFIGIVSFAIFFLMWRRINRSCSKFTGGRLTIISILLIIGFSLGVSFLINNFIMAFGILNLSPELQDAVTSTKDANLILRVVVIGLMAPVIEEFCFRGVIFNRMYTWMPKWVAVVFSSLAFAVMHMNVLQGIITFISGILLAIIYIKFKTLWAPIILHLINNLYSIFASMILNHIGINIPYWVLLLFGLVLTVIFTWLLFGHKILKVNKINMERKDLT